MENKCPKCNHILKNESDIVCLNCGYNLKSKTHLKFLKNQNSSVTASPAGSSILHQLSGILFFTLTISFTYIYIFNAEFFFKIPDKLFFYNKLSAAENIYAAYKYILLSQFQKDIQLKLKQIQLERKYNSVQKKADADLQINVIPDKNRTGNSIRINLTNNSLSSLRIKNNYFFFKDENKIYSLRLLSDKEKIVLSYSESKIFEFEIPNFRFDDFMNKIKSGKIIFNNGKKYVITDLTV